MIDIEMAQKVTDKANKQIHIDFPLLSEQHYNVYDVKNVIDTYLEILNERNPCAKSK